MCVRRTYLLLVLLFSRILSCAFAQDTRKVSEPTFSRTYFVDHATLRSAPLDGLVVGRCVEEQDAASNKQTDTLRQLLDHCDHGAVELALGTDCSQDAFLLNPINVPVGLSLVIDGGVTVYASRNPAKYQQDTPEFIYESFCLSATYTPSNFGRIAVHAGPPVW